MREGSKFLKHIIHQKINNAFISKLIPSQFSRNFFLAFQMFFL